MKKIVKLTESKLVEIVRNIVSEQQTMSRGTKTFDYNLLRKKHDAYVAANSELATGKYQSNPQVYAAMVAKVKALLADYEKMRKLMPPIELPLPTTNKFGTPEFKHDEEVTKPEPEEEPINEQSVAPNNNMYNEAAKVLQSYGFKCTTKSEKYAGKLICDGSTPQGKRAQFNMESNGNFSLGVEGKGRQGGVYKGGNFAPYFIKVLFSMV